MRAQELQAGDLLARDLLAPYLHSRASEFLRSLRLHRESGQDPQGAADAAEATRALRGAARRISGTLHTFRPLTDTGWADTLRGELAWLSGTLAREHAYAGRLNRLLEALNRLSGAGGGTSAAPGARESTASRTQPTGTLTVGAARAGALLERQLTLARTRAHSAALQALGSSRFHAVADAVALLASDVPLGPAAAAPAAEVLAPLAVGAEQRLKEAVAALPLGLAAHPYNAEALVHGLAATPTSEAQDAPWHQVRLLLRLHHYAQETFAVPTAPTAPTGTCLAAQALDRHRDAAEAAGAAASAARTPRIAPATAYALGVLHADQRHEVEAARFAFQQVWQRTAATAP
ncbi:CHAD domain-containing protein [Streptomyces sp. Wb2n-11]|uniref:CHAD domain-containing protein n=1 Tax=Streptomyces sp. Wb2n-11 TaxID=1030533 RepID=UPI0021001EFF|nr:CHAD domain-containing protein [Streptomyces sp. Wb2n-11]